MSNFGDHPAGFFGVSDFYNGVATQSLRFDGGAKLTRTPSSSGNQKKWTSSFWVKRSGLGTAQYLWSGGSYSGNDGIAAIYFESDNKIHTYFDTSGANPYGAVNDRLYRDTSSWYHIVWAVDAANTVHKIWVNGVEETLSSGSQPPNFDYGMNRSGTLQAFGIAAWGGSPNLNGYLAEITHLDGQYLDETYFGEFKNGVWIAKDTSDLTFGTNGFRLQLDQTGVGTASASTIGADTSGNANHFTSSGIVASDCAMPDSPENNFATLNPSYRLYNTSSSFAQGNLQHISNSTGVTSQGHSTIGLQQDAGGKWYAECRLNTQANGSTWIGVCRDVPKLAGGLFVAATRSNGYAYKITGNKTTTENDGSSYGNTYTAGDIIGIALDLDNDQIFFYKNGTIQNSGTAAFTSISALSNGTADTSQHFVFGADTDPQNDFTFNFGQDSTFGGTETAGGNTDANGIGDFLYTVPTGYLAVCTSNLPEPTIGPNSGENTSDYFNVVEYTGNGSTLSVTGFDHQPDLLWIKSRNITGNHRLTDSSRGVSFNWITNADDAEKGDSDAEDIDSFDTDGFTVTQASYDDFNDGSDTYLAFSWKANGGTDTATGNEDGNNPGYNQQASSKAGFSIIKYVGTQAAGTIPHGLGKKPDWMIFKNRTVNGNAPVVYHSHNTSAPATDHLTLNSGNLSVDNANRFNDTEPTSSVFTLGADGNINDDGVACIAYIWTGIEGFSKFGGYVGNSNSDGVFIYLGFRPAWVMYKGVEGVGNNWHINYPKLVTNENNKYVLGNGDGSEGSANAIDFLSNGFKFRHSSQAGNNSSGTYVYMAFAEAPFKYANAR